MLFDPSRHEPLTATAWDAQRARATIEAIVRDTEASFSPETYWPAHEKDRQPGEDPRQVSTTLYFGAAGVSWALRYLEAVGAVQRGSDWREDLHALRERNRTWLVTQGSQDFGAYLMGELPICLMDYADRADAGRAESLATLIEQNADNPARELMWGSPGSLLAAAFLHERTGAVRWADLYRAIAARLWSELQWSDTYGCRYWQQDLYGRRFTFLDGVHGFVASAHVLIRGRHLLAPQDWQSWQRCIVETIGRTATRDAGGMANWRPELLVPEGRTPPMLMQFCHGAPGFVICLAGLPTAELDELLLAAGRTVWAAGPLTKGANLCHGTAGNGYALLKLYERSGDAEWLHRARAFAMHAIAQAEADASKYGHLRYSLWTGDLGLAVYLWDCLRARGEFPTLDVFFGKAADPRAR